MNIKTLKCKIYKETDSEFDEKFTIGKLYLDLDMVSAWHVASTDDCTIVYLQGISHELLITVDEFSRLKGIQKDHKIELTFSKN
jgi:hypothetical protein